MEEIDEGRVKSTASGSANAKPNNNRELASNNNDDREEGELSASDDDHHDGENPVSSGAQSTGTVAPCAGTIFATAANNAEGTLMAKTAAGNNISSSADIQTRGSIQPNNKKSLEKNRVTFSGNLGWFPNSTNNNLVISFSDDDSGSSSEEFMHEKTFEIKSDATAVKNIGRPPASSLIKSNKLRGTARNVNKVLPKKSSSHRTFISPMSKSRGGANSRSAGLDSVEQGSRVRNFSTLNKNLGSQERGSDQEVGWKNSKLQDLRQQIALRESELKLKAAQQNKDLAVVSCNDGNAMNLNNDVARNYQSTSAHVQQSEQREPNRKRLKVNGSYTHRPTSDAQPEIAAAKSPMPAKESTLDNSSLHDRNMVDRGQKDIPTSRVEPGIAKQLRQDGRRIDVISEHIPSAVKDVADINSSCNQIEKDSRRVDPCVISSQTAPQAPQTNVNSSTSPKHLDGLVLNHPRTVGEHHPSNSAAKKATRKHNEMNSIDYRKAISGDKTAEPSFNNLCQVNNVSMWNCLSDVNVSGHSNMQSILDMEESMDKELEEAQEHRRMCEIEEINALKAYRKAQRALIEANARCSKLYRQRELCSARFRSLIMDDSNLLWSSRPHEPVGNQLDLSNHVSDMIPMSNHQMQPVYDVFNRQEYDPSIQCLNHAPVSAPYQHANRQILGSEACSEPDASTSEPLPHKSKNVVNRLSSQSNEFNVSADEDEETFPLDHESVQPNYENQQREHIIDGRQMGTNYESSKKLSIDSTQDPLLLEATLRSKLFARLGKRTLSKNNDSFNVEQSVEHGPDNDFGSDKMQMSNGSFLSLEGGQNQQLDTGGTDKPERSSHETPFYSTADPKENELPIRVPCSISELSSPLLVLRSTFDHLKVGSSISISAQVGNQQNHKCTLYIGEGTHVNSNETQDSCLIANSKEQTSMVYFGNKIGSYTCNLAMDPFWPICMYELRGKCNNDECPWQHVKDFSNEDMYQHRHDDSDSADCQAGLTIPQQNCDGATKISKFQNILTPPMYIISLDMLKADSHSYESVVARRHGQCWRKCFSVSLALSSMFQKDLPTELLHTSDGRIEVHDGWSGQSSYFQSRNGVMNQLKQPLLDKVQSVEMALLIINQEASKLEGVKKALSVLSRALEADRTSESLWMIYLLIYYGSTKSVGKDNMFSYAVKNNEGSYVLWLMYINSRIQIDDRFVAYDAALTALCRHALASDGVELNASACILDLFLQMVECLRMSGNIEKAIQRISGFFLAATNSTEPCSLLLCDILTCLTFSDKLIFWVCCVYLVIYRKLPDSVVQQFECEKELLSIEWPSIHLVDDEKQGAVKLVGTVVDSVESGINSESLKNEIDLRSLHGFAICHIMCVAALDGLESSRNLLEKYVKLYPSCLELVLMSARLQKNDFGDSSFVGFEEALIKWPKEVSGIQCIWNQYAEFALMCGRTGFAKELMDRWFHSVWKVQYPQYLLDARGGDISVSDKNQMDVMFGFLNLSLHNLLQNDRNEARLAIDRALKVVDPENFKHCVREHAVFLRTYESSPKEDALIGWQLNLLSRYLDISHSFPYSEPLPRLFINKIKKSRVQQLLRNLMNPISSDFSLVNSVLEVWYGPSLLPQNFSKLKDLVDIVEAIMEIVPSNYPLAFSICKLLLSRGYNPDDVNSISVLFWASSTLVSAIFHAVPIAPEYIWVEAADTLGNIIGIESISRFYKRALSVYPFSIKLWKCYHKLSETRGDTNTVVEAARENGIKLD